MSQGVQVHVLVPLRTERECSSQNKHKGLVYHLVSDNKDTHKKIS